MEPYHCVLCGQQVPPLSQSLLSFCGTSQPVCPDCDRRYRAAYPSEREALDAEILNSPRLLDRDTVLANLPPHLAASQFKLRGEAKRCPACGCVLDCKLENLSLGSEGGRGLLSLLCDQYDVDLYACPQCGKVELYTARFVPPQPEWERLLDTQPQDAPAESDGPDKKEFKLPWRREKPPWEK